MHLLQLAPVPHIVLTWYVELNCDRLHNILITFIYSLLIKRTEWSDLRQESPNEIEDPDIPDSDSTDAAVRLRNMANVSQR